MNDHLVHNCFEDTAKHILVHNGCYSHMNRPCMFRDNGQMIFLRHPLRPHTLSIKVDKNGQL